MKIAVKFALINFCLSTLILILEYLFFPSAYPNESLLIGWLYVINIPIGTLLFPFVVTWIRQYKFKSKIKYALLYFLVCLIIINIVPLLFGHVLYSLQLLGSIFDKNEMQIARLFEFINPIMSFCVTSFLFRNSEIWYPETSSK